MGYINRHKVFFAVQRQVYPANFQEKTITPNTFQREITPDAGYDALSKVKLNGILVDAHTEIESQVDSDVKYQKTVPAGALQYAGLNKVGGMSYKSLNKWDEQWEVGNYDSTNGEKIENAVKIRSKNLISVKPNTQYYFKSPVGLNLFFYDTNGDYINADTVSMTGNMIYTIPNNCYFIAFSTFGGTVTTYENNITINESDASINGNYYPYFTGLRHSPVTSIVSNETLNIPAQVQLLDGYGMGINSTLYNYIDFESKKFKKYVARVNLGSLNYIKYSDGIFYASLNDAKIGAKSLNSKYKTVANGTTWMNDLEAGFNNEQKIWYVRDDRYTDENTFQTAMSGEYLVFELETPVETDISEYITQDTLDVINTITFNNEYEQAVPSEINYLIEV